MSVSAAVPSGLSDGYCDSTGFGNEGACETDDKGAFSGISFSPRTTWEFATHVCRERCLSCARCNFISVSIHWRDCSWFNECALDRLHNDVAGHKSMRVRGSAGSEAGNPTAPLPALQALWPYLNNLPRVAPTSCWVDACSSARRSPHPGVEARLAVGITAIAQSWAESAEAGGSYGHIWRVVESFFTCVVLENLAANETAHRRVLVPASLEYNGASREPFRELLTLFSGSGSRMSLVRTPALPYCPPPWKVASSHQCCHNTSTRSALRHAHGGTSLRFVELRPWVSGQLPAHLQAMRHVVWANLGVYETVPDTVVFASSEGATNARRIANEAAVAEAVRSVVTKYRPGWRFRYQRLESLTYANELRLLRRTTMLVALFGSSLHNCRFLPEGTIVLQVHGALKGETSRGGAYLYRDVCHRHMGLPWAAYAVPGWKSDFAKAHVPLSEFGHFVSAALEGNFSALSQAFADAVTPPRGGRLLAERGGNFSALARVFDL